MECLDSLTNALADGIRHGDHAQPYQVTLNLAAPLGRQLAIGDPEHAQGCTSHSVVFRENSQRSASLIGTRPLSRICHLHIAKTSLGLPLTATRNGPLNVFRKRG